MKESEQQIDPNFERALLWKLRRADLTVDTLLNETEKEIIEKNKSVIVDRVMESKLTVMQKVYSAIARGMLLWTTGQ